MIEYGIKRGIPETENKFVLQKEKSVENKPFNKIFLVIRAYFAASEKVRLTFL